MALATTSGKVPCKSLKDELRSIIGNGSAWHFAEEIFLCYSNFIYFRFFNLQPKTIANNLNL